MHIQPFSRYPCKTTSSRFEMLCKLLYIYASFYSDAKIIVILLKTKKNASFCAESDKKAIYLNE